MKTMEELCKRFGDLHPGCDAFLDKIESYPGYYRICIYEKYDREESFTWYTFKTCKEFKEWSEGVIL